MKKYNPKTIESKWQKEWAEQDIVKIDKDDSSKEKYYVLDMFPYPSSDGLHMGHTENYTISDIIYRYKRMKGFNVLHPQGFDAFGLPAENYAIKTGVHPKETTKKNIENYIKQMQTLGLGYDFDEKIITSSPEYYKWTQWIFTKFFEAGLAYRKTDTINWCESCKTGLANEQVEGGKCERCKNEVVQKEVPGWFFKITDFADELIEGLENLDWPEHTKKNQINWIGESEGAEIEFEVKSGKLNNNKISNVVLFHGCPSDIKKAMNPKTRTHSKAWFPWVKNELEKDNIDVYFPEMPNPWSSVYSEYKKILDSLDINENSVLVGTSCGASFLVRWLGDTQKKIKKLILVAPWYEPNLDKQQDIDFYDFEINENIKSNIGEITIFTSDNDKDKGKESAKVFAEKLNAKIIKINGYGHYEEKDMGTNEFPELLEEIIQVSNFKVFTTRPDTLFGATYCVLAPEHALVGEMKEQIENWDEVEKYVDDTKKKTERERLEGKEKTGVELKGVKAINPANNEEIPIFIADYVLAHYGTGAIMAVPAHDERDFEFAKKFGLEIKEVVAPKEVNYLIIEKSLPENSIEQIKKIARLEIDKFIDDDWGHFWKVYVSHKDEKNLLKFLSKNLFKKGFYADSIGFSNFVVFPGIFFKVLDTAALDRFKEVGRNFGIPKDQLDIKLTSFKDNGILINSGKFDGMDSEEAKRAIVEFVGGKITNNYRLRDWSVSRQRYWGAPIPIVYDPEGNAQAVPEEHLPWTLPEDVDFMPTGDSPLVNSKELKEHTEKIFGKGWTPDTDTLDTFVDSSWYFLRYPDVSNEKEFCSKERLKHWLPVDLYIGGQEHTYMHLLYARFVVKAMKKLGLLDFSEPFPKLRHQGMVLDSSGVKMSKSKGNVINPDDMTAQFGADAVRMYMMFAGPLGEDVMWNENGVVGTYRFLEKVWKMQENIGDKTEEKIESEIHKTIKKVSDDLEALKFNTAISSMMKLLNTIGSGALSKQNYEIILKLLVPFAPHITEEIWHEIGNEDSIQLAQWPKADAQKIKEEEATIAVQVNGKVRGEFEIEIGTSEDIVKKEALSLPNIQKWTAKGEIEKVIYVENKLVNIVTIK